MALARTKLQHLSLAPTHTPNIMMASLARTRSSFTRCVYVRLLLLHEDARPAGYGLFFSVPFGARQPADVFQMSSGTRMIMIDWPYSASACTDHSSLGLA